jgi:hypothetical protein
MILVDSFLVVSITNQAYLSSKLLMSEDKKYPIPQAFLAPQKKKLTVTFRWII